MKLGIKKQSENEQKKAMKHMGMMGICCIIPIVVVTALPLLSNVLGKEGVNMITLLAPLICPIMLGIMMFGMLKGDKQAGCCTHQKADEIEEDMRIKEIDQ